MSNVIEVAGSPIERKDRPSQALAPMPDATPMQILAMAVQQGLDTDKLDKLMALQDRWEANQARKAFEAAISAAKGEIKPILKRREVDFTTQKGRTNYKYEDLGEIAEVIDPILGKYGLSYRHRSKQNGKSLTIICKIAHRDGHSEECAELTADNDESGNKNAIQGVGSTATYLQRYTLKIALGLAASKDTDGRQPLPAEPTLSDEQVANLKALLTEVNANEPAFLKWLKVRSLSEIYARNYDFCVKSIEAKRARQ